MGEAAVLKRVMLKASKLGFRLLRNSRGQFYTMDKKRIVRAGLEAEGSSDLIGAVPVVITEEMVGMTLGVFCAAEVKKPEWKKPSGEHERVQENFINQMIKFGCIAFFINDHELLEKKIADCLKKMIDAHKKL